MADLKKYTKIIEYLSENKIEETLEEIEIIMETETQNHLFIEFIMISARYHRLKNAYLLGLISLEGLNIGENKTIQSLLMLLGDIEQAKTVPLSE